MQAVQCCGHASHTPPAPSKKPALHEQVPSPLADALALHCVQVPGAEHASHPERHTGVWHRDPVYSVPLQSHVQSAFCVPCAHATVHWHTPAKSHAPMLGAQLLLSHSTLHVGP